jgi:hypothetical protein
MLPTHLYICFMATLTGKKIKDTYYGLLKTTDDTAVASSLKVITTAENTNSGLSLSTTTVKAENLQIGTVAEDSTETKTLVWDSTSKVVGYRTIPASITATSSVTVTGGSSSGVVQYTDQSGNTTDLTWVSGTNIQVSGSSADDEITVAHTKRSISKLDSGGVSLTTAAFGKYIFLDLNTMNGADITLPSAEQGAFIDFQMESGASSATTEIKAASGDVFKGRVIVYETGADDYHVDYAGATDDQISLASQGTTTGGSEGDTLRFICYDDGTWYVDGHLTTKSTVTTVAAFSAQP